VLRKRGLEAFQRLGLGSVGSERRRVGREPLPALRGIREEGALVGLLGELGHDLAHRCAPTARQLLAMLDPYQAEELQAASQNVAEILAEGTVAGEAPGETSGRPAMAGQPQERLTVGSLLGRPQS